MGASSVALELTRRAADGRPMRLCQEPVERRTVVWALWRLRRGAEIGCPGKRRELLVYSRQALTGEATGCPPAPTNITCRPHWYSGLPLQPWTALWYLFFPSHSNM